ncbi:MAG TPA: M56 family metallopeptidase [Vicinamibacterales bacterium]|nr:M56 family metallopeptidase [Vicinamibacterales bacterium]
MTLLLLNTTIKVSIIVLAALAATAMLRFRSAAVRHFVLAIALACAAATPAVRLVAPAWQAAPRMQLLDRPLAVFDDGPLSRAAVVSTPAQRSIAPASLMRAAAIVWATGAGLSLLTLFAGFARLSWIASHATAVVDGPWMRTASELARACRLRRVPLVLQSDHPSALGTWGVWRPKVVLPADARSWPDERIRIVLGHELAHVSRRDWVVQTAAELLCALYWFNPLVWLAARRLRLESEQACDDAVLALGVEGADYASELVDLARACRPERLLLVPTATIARPSSLERRVRAMLNATVNRDPLTRSASIAAALVLAVVTVLVAGLGVSAQSQFATVSGTVTDQHGRPIKGVRLVLSNGAAQTKNEVKSDASGYYEFVGIPSGTYELMFESPGMAYLKREGLTVASGQAVQINAVMKIGSVEETISVYGTPDEQPLVRGYSGPRPADKPDACAQSASGGCIRPPVKIKDVRPVYPLGSRGGTVELIATIGADGLVNGVDVISNRDGGPAEIALADAAAEAVQQWEFMPTHLDGKPIETNMKVHVTFATR